MKLRVYLDTSVFSAYFDGHNPSRQEETRELFESLTEYEVSTSEVGQDELLRTTDPELREKLRGLLARFPVSALTEEMVQLARRYVSFGVFTPKMRNDALHVAAAVLSRQDVLLSWNFRHLVNRRRRALISQLNTMLGLPAIDIIAPPEL